MKAAQKSPRRSPKGPRKCYQNIIIQIITKRTTGEIATAKRSSMNVPNGDLPLRDFRRAPPPLSLPGEERMLCKALGTPTDIRLLRPPSTNVHDQCGQCPNISRLGRLLCLPEVRKKYSSIPGPSSKSSSVAAILRAGNGYACA